MDRVNRGRRKPGGNAVTADFIGNAHTARFRRPVRHCPSGWLLVANALNRVDRHSPAAGGEPEQREVSRPAGAGAGDHPRRAACRRTVVVPATIGGVASNPAERQLRQPEQAAALVSGELPTGPNLILEVSGQLSCRGAPIDPITLSPPRRSGPEPCGRRLRGRRAPGPHRLGASRRCWRSPDGAWGR